jgi:hypothetical protein
MRALFSSELSRVSGGKTDYIGKFKEKYGDNAEIHSIEHTLFSDSSLGLAKPGYAYAQVITPGAIITATVNGVKGIYHVGDFGGVVQNTKY